jgi:lysophospholipase L1-like esterase
MAIAEAAAQFNFDVVDGSTIPFPSFNSYWKTIVLPDGLHPSDTGHSLYAKYLYNKLLNN